MNKPVSHPENSALRERLRREAMESRPAFCESLHRQILAAVKREETDHAYASPSVASRPLRRQFVVAVALVAACALVVVLSYWQNADRGSLQNVTNENSVVAESGILDPVFPMASMADLVFGELGNDSAKGLDGLIASTAVVPQSAALKHDIRLAAVVLIERLPVDMDLLAGP